MKTLYTLAVVDLVVHIVLLVFAPFGSEVSWLLLNFWVGTLFIFQDKWAPSIPRRMLLLIQAGAYGLAACGWGAVSWWCISSFWTGATMYAVLASVCALAAAARFKK